MGGTEYSGGGLKCFVESTTEWEALCLGIKQNRCPHCLTRGTLTRHGFLYGYAPLGTNGSWTRKGFRLLCSNRHRYRGCGRTVSVWFSSVLRRCMVSAQDLWQFALGLIDSGVCYTVARRLAIASSPAMPYRWKARLERAQLRLRSLLHPHFPACAAHRVLPWPWMQPYDQLKELGSEDAIRWLQYRFQTSLFPP